MLTASILPQMYDFAIIPFIMILSALMKFLFKFRLKEILTVLIVFIMALSLYRSYDNFVCRKITAFNMQEISFNGKITDISEHTGDKCTYYAKGKINGKYNAKITVYADLYNCTVSDRIEFTGTAEVPENDYLFEGRDYYKSQGDFSHML